MNIIILLLGAFIVSFLITNFMIPNILLASLKKRLIDVPNKRKVHTVTSSRLGGVSFYPSIIVSLCLMFIVGMWLDASVINTQISIQFMLTACAVFVMYIVGLFDDIIGVRYSVKFVLQALSSLFILSSGMWVNNLHGFCGLTEVPVWIGFPLSLMLLVFIMNAINLIDGIDGLASGLSMIALLVFAIYFIYLGEIFQSMVAIASLGSLLAFFRYNVQGFHHKQLKIFMGDTGSLVVGLILGVCAIKLVQQEGSPSFETFPLLVAYSVLIVPSFDVIRVMISRKMSGKSMFLPDKRHIHHKFLALGFSARRSMCTILLISIIFIVMNVLLYYVLCLEIIVLIDIIIYVLLNVFVSRKINRKL